VREPLVVDASVACKWLIPEPFTPEAMRLLNGGYELCAPDFILAEIYNFLGRKVTRKELTTEQARALKVIMDGHPLTLTPYATLLEDAFDLALTYQRAVYDCLYLALAVTGNCRLITADAKFVNGLKGTPLARVVLWLNDI
jgi:predicted nucleic acid-binding protein